MIPLLIHIASGFSKASVFINIAFLAASLAFLSQRNITKRLIWIFVAWRFFYAAFLTGAQYVVWSHSQFTRIFTSAPVAFTAQTPEGLKPLLSLFHWRGGYFTFYSFAHFWFRFLLSLFSSLLFYAVLLFSRRYRKEMFAEGEPELALLSALLVGWPGFVIFVPLAFSFALLLSIVRLFIFKQPSTSIAYPFLIATVAFLLWHLMGDPISFFHLSVLRV